MTLVKPPTAEAAKAPAHPAAEVELAREITFLDATMMGVGALMGGGVFVLIGIAAGVSGPAVILALFLNGFITLPTLMVYAELGSASDDAGGGYQWAREGLGQPFGFLAGWLGWFSHAIACALYSLAAAAFILFIGRSAGWIDVEPQTMRILALVIAALFIAFNYAGVRTGVRTQNTVNTAVLGVVLIFLGFGLWRVWQDPATVSYNLDPFFPAGTTMSGMSQVLLAMGITFVAFEGYEIIAQASEEIQQPRRNVPRAIWASFLIAWAIMLVAAFVIFGATTSPDGTQSWTLLAGAAEYALVEAAGQWMPFGAVVMAGAALLLQITALNTTIYSTSRVSFAMGRDGNLPSAFGKIHPQRRTPHIAVVASGILILAMALLPIATVAVTAAVMFLLLFVLVNVAYVKLRKTMPQDSFGFRAPFFPYLPLVAIAAKFSLAIYLWKYSHIAWYVALGWIALGLGLYYVHVRPRELVEPRVEARSTFAARPAGRTLKLNRVLVLLSSPAPSTARSLARTAAAIANATDGEVVILQPVVVPDVTPLDEGRRLFKGNELLGHARGVVPTTVPVHTLVRIGHDLDAIVRQVVREEGISLLLTSAVGEATVGQPTSTLIAYPPCDLGLLRHRNENVLRKILVPIRNGDQSPLAARLASAIAKSNGGSVTLYHVHAEDDTGTEAWTKDLHERTTMPGTLSNLVVEEGSDPVARIVKKSEGQDLVIVGARAPPFLRKSLLGPRTRAVTDTVACNVLIVRSPRNPMAGPPGLGRRLLQLRRYILPE